MKIFEISDALLDAYCTESINDISDVQDELRYGSWYMEEGSNDDESFISRLKTTVKKFFTRIRAMFDKLFTSKAVNDALEIADKNGTGSTNDRDPENTSIKLSKQKQSEEICKLGDQTLQVIARCETPQDVEKEMQKYRKKITALKATVIITTITLVGGGLYIDHKRKATFNEYKRKEQSILKELDIANNQIAAERTVHATEINALRADVETNASKIVGLEKEVNRLQVQNKVAQKQGAAEGRAAILKAQLEVISDQSRATTDAIGEITQKISAADSLREKISVVTNTVKEITTTNENIAKDGIKNAKSLAKDVHDNGLKLRKSVDNAIRVLESSASTDDKKREALQWLIKWEPTFRNLGGKYATMRHDIIAWENNVKRKSIQRANSVPK